MIDLTTCKIVCRIALVTTVAVFFGLIFEQSDASAEQCKDNQRGYSGKNSKALTRVVNDSDEDITVKIFRRISTKKDGSYEEGGSSYTDETVVDTTTVDSGGGKLENKINVSTYQENRVQIQFNSLGTSGTYCEYKVRTGENNTNWSRVKDGGNLVDCYGVKALDVCANCGISCSRSYDKGKDEWKTTFTVTSYN